MAHLQEAIFDTAHKIERIMFREILLFFQLVRQNNCKASSTAPIKSSFC